MSIFKQRKQVLGAHKAAASLQAFLKDLQKNAPIDFDPEQDDGFGLPGESHGLVPEHYADVGCVETARKTSAVLIKGRNQVKQITDISGRLRPCRDLPWTANKSQRFIR